MASDINKLTSGCFHSSLKGDNEELVREELISKVQDIWYDGKLCGECRYYKVAHENHLYGETTVKEEVNYCQLLEGIGISLKECPGIDEAS